MYLGIVVTYQIYIWCPDRYHVGIHEGVGSGSEPEIKVLNSKILSPCWEMILSPVNAVTMSAWGLEIISGKQ